MNDKCFQYIVHLYFILIFYLGFIIYRPQKFGGLEGFFLYGRQSHIGN